MSDQLPADTSTVPDFRPAPTRVHPDDRARLAASNRVAQLAGVVPIDGPQVSYYSPELILATLPHSDPKNRDWIRHNGQFVLIVSSGVDENARPYGVPFGSFPRLCLAWFITRVIETRDKRIELSSHFGAFLREVGYTGNLRGRNTVGGRRMREQLLRLLRARITFQWTGNSGPAQGIAVRDVNVAPQFALWFDTSKPEEGSLFGSWIELGEEFYQSILRAPVPLRTDCLRSLKKSPLALDVYMWVSYRLFGMQAAGQDELTLSYGALQSQFGTGIAEENYRQFRARLKKAFTEVAAAYQPHTGDTGRALLNYELGETGLTLYRSPLLIGRSRPSRAEDSRRILETRTFDADTLKKARQLSGNWDLKYLERQYFAWTEGKPAPKDLRRAFLGFVKRHVERNGRG